MASKTFLTIPKEECLQAYKEVFENSERKWTTSKSLADQGDYGSAVFMSITSVEELVKALIILMDGRGFSLRNVEGIGVIFRNHQIRYLLSYAMFVVNVAAEEVRDLILKARTEPDQGSKWIDGVMSNDEKIILQVQEYALKKFQQIVTEFDWFDQLHFFRQDSLYCDYQDYMKNPIQISADNYFETVTRLEKVRTVGQGLIETLNSKEALYVDHYENMKRMFIEKDFYQHIEQALQRLKGTRDTPFQALKKYFMTR